MRKIWTKIIVNSLLGFTFFAFLSYSHEGSFPAYGEQLQFLKLFISIAVANIAGFAVLLLDQKLDGFVHWRSNTFGRFLAGLTFNYLLALTLCIGASIIFLTLFGMGWETIKVEYGELGIKSGIILLIYIIIYETGYFAFYSYNEFAHVQIGAIKEDRTQIQLQFEALKSQLSPHYLFNSLNTISSLVYKNPDTAEEYIRRLAETYQFIINTNRKKLISVAEEVEFVKSYYFLLKVRYQNSFALEINIPDNVLDTEIPPLTLQILVENAVKHNVLTKDRPLKVYIGAIDNTHLRIKNTITESPSDVMSFKIGLENIRKRYKFYTNRPIKIEQNGTFEVQLPVLIQNPVLV